MCGVAGYLGNKNFSTKKVNFILNMMKLRGPNNQDYKKINFIKKNIYLFSSRLSIVDRYPRSNQPMEFDGYTISFNGEIYNTAELIKILKKHNINLKTKSDTEIILRLYILFKEKVVKFLNGMWSFVIIDQNNKQIFLSRDRIGEKPLFYLIYKNQFFFGSQTSYIRKLASNYKKLNRKKIFSFLKFGYKNICSNNETFFEKIYSVKPGQNLLIDEKLNIKINKYWKPSLKENKFLKEKDTIKLIHENFKNQIQRICKLDLKIGLSLSGGIDSSFLLGYFKSSIKGKIKTYSIIDKDERYNEEDLIIENLKKHKIPNTKIKINKKENYFNKLKELIKFHDKPISTINYFLQSLIYEKMKKDKIKVAIGGNGVDELFAGYYHHYQLYYNSLKSLNEKKIFYSHWKKKILPILRNPNFKKLDQKLKSKKHTFLKNSCLKTKEKILFKDYFFLKNKLRNKLLNELFYQTVPIALIEDDLNSMHNSIENRSPFLNYNLIEKSFLIPTKYLMKNASNKYLIRKSAKNFIPEKVRLNREKKGFNASFKSIFDIKDTNFKFWLLNKKSPIFKFIKFNKVNDLFFNKNNKMSDLDEQNLFNIVSTKIFLESIK